MVLTGESAHFEERFGPLGKWFDVYAFKTEGYEFGVIFTDITEKKKAKEELKRHAALLDVSNEAIFSFDFEGRMYLGIRVLKSYMDIMQ